MAGTEICIWQKWKIKESQEEFRQNWLLQPQREAEMFFSAGKQQEVSNPVSNVFN